MSTCQYFNFISPYSKCKNRPLESDNYCILHSDKLDKDKTAFNAAIKKKLLNGDYDFSGILFPGTFSFADYVFKSYVDFSNATFLGGIYFKGTKFEDRVYFFNTTFISSVVFWGAIFNEVRFDKATFSIGPFFNDAIFLGSTSFKNTKFSGRSFFKNTKFSGEVDFNKTVFTDLANFESAHFSKKVSFWKAVFLNGCTFFKVTFSNYISFDLVKFYGGSSFTWSNFHKEAFFAGAAFLDNVSFEWARFLGNSSFDGVIFKKEACFCGSTIGSKFIFYKVNSGKEDGELIPFFADLSLLKIEPDAIVVFQDLSLANVEFSETNMLKLKFHHVTWNNYHGRQAVYDEELLDKKEPLFWRRFYCIISDTVCGPSGDEYARVEEIYRYLKLNYEYEGNFKHSGDFHYGEMEMHRRASKWRWLPLSWHNLYRVFSGYGERPLRAFIWLLALIPLWAGLVWGLGIDQAAAKTPINYGDTLLYIFEKVTFQRPALPAGLTWLGKFLSGLSVLLIPGQAALFILALRNRLGRRR